MRVSYGNSITCHAAGLIALSEVFSILKHVMFEPSKLRNPSPQPAEALPTSPLKVVERNVYISVDTEGNPAELWLMTEQTTEVWNLREDVWLGRGVEHLFCRLWIQEYLLPGSVELYPWAGPTAGSWSLKDMWGLIWLSRSCSADCWDSHRWVYCTWQIRGWETSSWSVIFIDSRFKRFICYSITITQVTSGNLGSQASSNKTH